MKISFIITIYNKSRYLKRVIDALKEQKGGFETEYIFVDDGSTDNSRQIVADETALLNNVIIITQENNGPSSAINNALSYVTGDFVQFVDGDDLLAIGSTELLLKGAMDAKAEVVFGRLGKYDLADNLDVTQPMYRANLIEDSLYQVIIGKIRGINAIGATKGMVSSKLLRQISGSDQKVFSQDFSISLRGAVYSSFVAINQIVALTPKSYDPQHLSYNKAQEEHDQLLALYNFIQEYQDEACKHLVALRRRQAKIMFKKALREEGIWAICTYEGLQYIKAKLVKNISLADVCAYYQQALSEFDGMVLVPKKQGVMDSKAKENNDVES